ncbi:hypothetical protein KJ765_02645 [Candidatus Micrarchaeota archaeon]|nr:hypothetical protein [Candidatus Micrarchaeota archaeon]
MQERPLEKIGKLLDQKRIPFKLHEDGHIVVPFHPLDFTVMNAAHGEGEAVRRLKKFVELDTGKLQLVRGEDPIKLDLLLLVDRSGVQRTKIEITKKSNPEWGKRILRKWLRRDYSVPNRFYHIKEKT